MQANREHAQGVDPALLAALKATVTAAVSSSLQTETSLLTARIGLVTSRFPSFAIAHAANDNRNLTKDRERDQRYNICRDHIKQRKDIDIRTR
eukprot:SAG31_NODE_6649_length_1938_cov_1.240348_2_plen_93_part_00